MNKHSVSALIPAAGSGTRLGQGPKAFVTLQGRSLLERAVAHFLRPDIQEVIVAVSEDMLEQAQRLLPSEVTLVPGGTSRQDTVYQLLQQATTDHVIIHDAARPFLPKQVLSDCLNQLNTEDALTVAKAVPDTLLHLPSSKTINRDELRAIQTPQAFARTLLLKAHQQAFEKDEAATDDAGLVRRLHHRVTLVDGSPWLFKITLPDDLTMAKALAPLWDSHEF